MNLSEGQKARRWRETVVKLSRKALAERTGYTEASIQNFERGRNYLDVPITKGAMQKYRMACAAVHVGINGFDWERTHVARQSDSVAA